MHREINFSNTALKLNGGLETEILHIESSNEEEEHR